jgi:hypothetical protein
MVEFGVPKCPDFGSTFTPRSFVKRFSVSGTQVRSGRLYVVNDAVSGPASCIVSSGYAGHQEHCGDGQWPKHPYPALHINASCDTDRGANSW